MHRHPVRDNPANPNRTYGVDRATNRIVPEFVPIATDLPAAPPVNVHTEAVNGINKAFYRVNVEKR
jgi:hypothetical protein